MYTWTQYPFLRITALFILGILLYGFLPISVNQNVLITGFFILFIAFLAIKISFKKFNTISGNIGLALISLIGFTNSFFHDQSNEESHIIHFEEKINGYKAIVNSGITEKEKYFIYDVTIKKIITDNYSSDVSGIIRLYIKRTENDQASLSYGDILLVKGEPFRLSPPDNPGEFNYMKYMAAKNIYFQQFIDLKDIQVIGNNPSNHLMGWAIKLRRLFSQKIAFHIQKKEEAAIAQALILGVKDGLDNKIKNSYASAGAMHVLAVSGLHAGIIYLILQFFFRPFIKRKPWKFILPILSIACLWCFAMITGLSPSIMRATTMFTIIIIGEYYFNRPNIFNSLAISALILLFYNPNFLFSVGFQLSYAAVVGIVYLFPLIYGLMDCRYWLLDKIWSISSVSIAAQIATFPLTIYYFHQFPVYFLISNLIVIPAAFLIMSLGLLLLSSNFFFLSDFIGFILELIISLLNSFVFYVEEMEMSLIKWLYIDELQTIMIYGVILFILMLIHYRKMIFMKLTVVCVIIISVSGINNVYQQSKTKQLVFYEIKGQSLTDDISGLRANLLTIKEPEDIDLVKHQIEPNRLSHNLPPVLKGTMTDLTSVANFESLKLAIWQGRKVLFIAESLGKLQLNRPIVCDIIVVSNNSVKKIEPINKMFIYEELIIDSSNDYYTAKFLNSQCEELGIKCSSVLEEGAIIIEN